MTRGSQKSSILCMFELFRSPEPLAFSSHVWVSKTLCFIYMLLRSECRLFHWTRIHCFRCQLKPTSVEELFGALYCFLMYNRVVSVSLTHSRYPNSILCYILIDWDWDIKWNYEKGLNCSVNIILSQMFCRI